MMCDARKAANRELIDVLTAISTVSMRLAVKLEMLERAEQKRRTREGVRTDEAVRSQSGNRRAYCEARP